MIYTSKQDLVNGLRKQLEVSDRQAVKGLMSVYANQLEDEKQEGEVRHNNGIGFTPTDAKILSSFAE